MESISNFEAIVIVTLDADAMSGRPGYRSGIMPGHRVPGQDSHRFTGSLVFEDREWLRPGESARAAGRFIVYTADLPLFEPGFRWELCEADRVVGSAELVSRGQAAEVPGPEETVSDESAAFESPGSTWKPPEYSRPS